LIALVVAAAVVIQLVSGVDDHHHGSAKESLHNYRVDSQNFHIDKLEEEVSQLEEDFEKLSDIPDRAAVTRIKARIRNLEDDGCEDDHVQCGGEIPECISPLFVCDGIDDCKNANDESNYTCSDRPYHVGSTIAGITSWHDCVPHASHMTVVTITAFEKPEAFPVKVYVKGVVSFEVDEHSHLVQSYNVKGHWNAGRRLLVLVPETGEDDTIYGHGIICHFNLGSHDEADCKIRTVSSALECATFHASRQ